jgi:ornithine cyclodeaminase/alanine dehydrogenase-like protein (mu-crystallin family)
MGSMRLSEHPMARGRRMRILGGDGCLRPLRLGSRAGLMAHLLVLGRTEVAEALPLGACIDAVADALAALARGELNQPLRWLTNPPTAEGDLSLMPVHRGGARPLFGLKALCVIPDNPARGLDTHRAS